MHTAAVVLHRDSIAEVVMRALTKKPADRQPDAHAFALDLAAAAALAAGPDSTAVEHSLNTGSAG